MGRAVSGRVGARAVWHCVVGQGDRILGVFGSALLAEAQECARKAERETGFEAYVYQFKGLRPMVGQLWTGRLPS